MFTSSTVHAHGVERIGKPGIAWATRYATGWTVYSITGMLQSGVDELAARVSVDILLAIFDPTGEA